jgi:hypothetical protein
LTAFSLAFANPSVPSAASITLYPALFSVNATICRIEGESSTAKIESIADFLHSKINKILQNPHFRS